MTEPALPLIPDELLSPTTLCKRIACIERLLTTAADSIGQLCQESERLESADSVIVRTATRGLNQLTWRWRETGEKCPHILAVIDAAPARDILKILSLDEKRVALNYELSVYGSELGRLREAQLSRHFHVSIPPATM